MFQACIRTTQRRTHITRGGRLSLTRVVFSRGRSLSHDTSHTHRGRRGRDKAVTRPNTGRAGRPGAPISKVYSQVLKTTSSCVAHVLARRSPTYTCDTIKTANVSSLQPRTTWSYFGRGRGHEWALGILGPRRCRSWRPWWRRLRRRRLRPGWRGHPGFARSCVQLEGARDIRREAEELTEPSRLLLA